MSMAGAVLSIPSSFIQELFAGGLLVAYLGAPIIEEATKPIGLYILLYRWPHLLPGRLGAGVLAGAAGLGFALAESTLYVTLYFPDLSSDYVVFRFTVPVLVHVTASFIFGLGITARLRSAVNDGPLVYKDWWFFGTAAALHGAYNIVATILELFTDVVPS